MFKHQQLAKTRKRKEGEGNDEEFPDEEEVDLQQLDVDVEYTKDWVGIAKQQRSATAWSTVQLD